MEGSYLKPPESPNRKVFVEISNVGQVVSVAEVHVRVVAIYNAHLLPDKLVL